MQILVLNLGSTSFKFELFNSETLESLQKGNFEIEQIEEGIQEEVNRIFREVLRKIGEVDNIESVGHRVVHGGEKYTETLKINQENISELEEINSLAPLHNPFNLAGIKSVQEYLPEVDNYAVFDTALYKNLPEHSKVYPIPYEYYEQGIRKFGFHGISHKYAVEQAAQKLKKDLDKINLISVHLGGGCSITAFENGKPIDTSMGFTPMQGLMMQTRSGDIDPGIIFKLIEQEEDTKIVKDVLNKESGIKGVCGLNNYLDLLEAVKNKDEKAILAFKMYISSIQKYIGAYIAILGHVDVIVFTGKIGAGKIETHNAIMKSQLFKDIKSITVDPWEELAIAKEIKENI
ncbi:MAG: acetate/propionate family kinase [Patescibacteria group bacterium]